jgi:hypothetical protein
LAAGDYLIYAKINRIRATFWLDHLAFRRINIMISAVKVLSLASNSGGAKMPAQEPSDRDPSTEPSSTHTWLLLEGRHLEIEAGKPLLHRFCTTCRRNFVCELSSRKWHAVLPRIFDFEHLDQVTEQWLKETCPRQYLTSDAVVRQLSRI